MIWRDISSVRVNVSFFHAVHSVEIAKILSHTFLQKFRESNGFSKEITRQLLWRIFLLARENFLFFHNVSALCICGKVEFTLTNFQQKLREINLFRTLFKWMRESTIFYLESGKFSSHPKICENTTLSWNSVKQFLNSSNQFLVLSRNFTEKILDLGCNCLRVFSY